MKYIDGFREQRAARALCGRIRELAGRLDGKCVSIMEVCGSHTMAIARYGIRGLLPDNLRLLSGPGCPVCVTAPGYVDAALELAARGVRIATFGDMLHVPGSERSLAACRADGGRIEVVYSPLNALELARTHPDEDVVFLAIGFETTIAPGVGLVAHAEAESVDNVSLLTAFKLVPPALRAVLDDPEVQVDAFLCPAHVSAIIGAEAYRPFAEEDRIPCVIAGFEPLDILYGIVEILEQIVDGRCEVGNQYARVVRAGGNPRAQALIGRYLEPVDAEWRGIGRLPASGMKLAKAWDRRDAAVRFGVRVGEGRTFPGCLCGDVIKGKVRPPDCPFFAGRCTPRNPLGPCMVSAEGTCAAYYKYSRL